MIGSADVPKSPASGSLPHPAASKTTRAAARRARIGTWGDWVKGARIPENCYAQATLDFDENRSALARRRDAIRMRLFATREVASGVAGPRFRRLLAHG